MCSDISSTFTIRMGCKNKRNLPSVEHIAWSLRLRESVVVSLLDELKGLGGYSTIRMISLGPITGMAGSSIPTFPRAASMRFGNGTETPIIGYITPKDMLAGRQQEIHTERDRKLEAARKQRQNSSPVGPRGKSQDS
jgi:hypothetical protein